jgi:hypothetical protein
MKDPRPPGEPSDDEVVRPELLVDVAYDVPVWLVPLEVVMVCSEPSVASGPAASLLVGEAVLPIAAFDGPAAVGPLPGLPIVELPLSGPVPTCGEDVGPLGCAPGVAAPEADDGALVGAGVESAGGGGGVELVEVTEPDPDPEPADALDEIVPEPAEGSTVGGAVVEAVDGVEAELVDGEVEVEAGGVGAEDVVGWVVTTGAGALDGVGAGVLDGVGAGVVGAVRGERSAAECPLFFVAAVLGSAA